MGGGGSIRWAACALALAVGIGVGAVPDAASASIGKFGMAVQPDGKILVAGGSGRVGGAASGDEVGAVVRYEDDGRLDRSFGGGDGVALIREMQPFISIALQPNGRILVTAPLAGRGLARLLPNGRLDRSFGGGGILFAGAGSAWHPTSVAVGGDGAIFVGGMTGYLEEAAEHWYGSLYRIAPDGRSGEWVGSMTSREGRPGEPKTFVNDFVIEAGRVIGAGTLAAREPGARSQAVLARLIPGTTTAGQATGPDPSFGAGAGLVISNFFPASPASEVANALSWDRGRGKLLLAGQADQRLLLARYTGDGVLDGRFGRGGAVVTGLRATATANAVAVQSGGGILAAGGSGYRCGGGECQSLLLVRYKGSGKLDRRFAGDGIVSPRVDTGAYGGPAGEVAYGVAGRPGGAVLVGGLVSGPGSSRFFLRRYLADGKPDLDFGNRGRLTTLPLVAGTPAPGSGR